MNSDFPFHQQNIVSAVKKNQTNNSCSAAQKVLGLQAEKIFGYALQKSNGAIVLKNKGYEVEKSNGSVV